MLLSSYGFTGLYPTVTPQHHSKSASVSVLLQADSRFAAVGAGKGILRIAHHAVLLAENVATELRAERRLPSAVSCNTTASQHSA